jgi:hypothetical protein
MTDSLQIEIPLSKKKMFLTLFGSIVFVTLGFWFLFYPPQIDNPFFGNSTIIFLSGLASIIFFGLIAITITKKISDNKAGFVINDEGIIDNSSGVSAGLVKWIDIQEIKQINVMNQRFLMFIVKNPQGYIDRETNIIKRKAMQMNFNSYGSPISISANALDTDFDRLHELLKSKFVEKKS